MAEDEAPPERKAPDSGPPAKGNIVTRKLGPLPVWGWVVIGAGVLFLIKKRKSVSSSTSGAAAVGPTSAVTSGTGLPPGYTGGADNAGMDSLLQQLQAQLAAQNTTTSATGATSNQFLHVPDWATNAELAAAGIQQYVQIGPNAFAPAQLIPGSPYGQTGQVANPAGGNTYYLAPGQSLATPDANGLYQGSVAGGPTYGPIRFHPFLPSTNQQAPVSGVTPFPVMA